MTTIYGHECTTCTGTAFGDNDQCAYCIRADAVDEEAKQQKQRDADNRFRTFHTQSSIYNMGESE